MQYKQKYINIICCLHQVKKSKSCESYHALSIVIVLWMFGDNVSKRLSVTKINKHYIVFPYIFTDPTDCLSSNSSLHISLIFPSYTYQPGNILTESLSYLHDTKHKQNPTNFSHPIPFYLMSHSKATPLKIQWSGFWLVLSSTEAI